MQWKHGNGARLSTLYKRKFDSYDISCHTIMIYLYMGYRQMLDLNMVGKKVKVKGKVINYILSLDSAKQTYVSHVLIVLEDEYGNEVRGSESWIKTNAVEFD